MNSSAVNSLPSPSLWLPLFVLLVIGICAVPGLAEDDTRYPFTSETLPAGWKITGGVVMSKALLGSFSRKFGGQLSAATNQDLSINGFGVRVNAITAVSEGDAEKVEAALLRIRGADFIRRCEARVYEVASQSVLVARVVFAALGIDADAEIAWKVSFRIALVDEFDDTAGNRVFNHFLALEKDPNDAGAKAAIATETKGWSFGTTLRLLDGAWTITPEPASAKSEGGVTTYTFEDPPVQEGVPYVDVTGTVKVPTRFAPTPGEAAEGLTAETPYWPVKHYAVSMTVRQATAGYSEPRAKLVRLLDRVHQNVRYGGDMGSRDGVVKVLERARGRCWDKSDVLVTYLRAAGIPAREVAGWVPPLDAGHVWVEAHVGDGWIPVDATTTWLGTSAEYIPFFRTDDGKMPIVYLKMPVIERSDAE